MALIGYARVSTAEQARLERSLPHLIETISAQGQFERDLIRKRTKVGLTAAAARGRKGGRKPVISADKLQRARVHIANRLNVCEDAMGLKVGKTALYAALQSASVADS